MVERFQGIFAVLLSGMAFISMNTSSTYLTNMSWIADMNGSQVSTEENATEMSFYDRAVSLTLYQAGLGFHHLMPVFTTVGLVGNSISFIVMTRPQNWKTSCCVYMAVLSVNDNLMLLDGMYFYLWFNHFPKFGNRWSCELITYLYYICGQNATYLIVAMTFDRFIAVVVPLKTNSICTHH